MDAQIDPISMKNRGLQRGCVCRGFLEGPWDAKTRLLIYFPVHFGTIFAQKSKKWHPKRHPKIDAEKVSKNHEKSIQNDAKMDAKINDF